MQSQHVWLVVGTRPEAIKIAPVAAALDARGVGLRIVLTGQHPALDPAEHGLAHFPIVNLDCAGCPDADDHVAMVRQAMPRAFAPGPALVIVQGDTSSACGAALAANDCAIPVAHVEAGLRTGDLSSPWPEEGYRIAIDRVATLLFAPTEGAADALGRERVYGAIFVTGNSGVDATLGIEPTLPAPTVRDSVQPRLLVTCHRRESWGAGLAGVAHAVRSLVSEGADVRFVLHPNSHVEATMRAHFDGVQGVELIAPMPHRALLQEMRGADLILSDSGGMQEEAPVLGIPMLVLRDKTERPEGVAQGHAMLVGTDPERILDAVRRLLGDPAALAAMSRRGLPYGDGRASARIAALVSKWLEGRRIRAWSRRWNGDPYRHRSNRRGDPK